MKSAKKESRKVINKRKTTGVKAKRAKRGIDRTEDVKKLVHLLEVSQVELEHQNQELRITEEGLEASRNKYVNFFDFSPIPCFVLDPDGIIKEVNLIAVRMLGTDRSKLVGRNINAHIPVEERNVFSAFMKAVFDSPVKQSCKLKVINKEKRVFPVLLEGAKSEDTLESGQRCQIALIDLTESKKLEESLKALSEELELLKAAKGKFTS